MTYDLAKQAFADWGVDTEVALSALEKIAISVHCWQGDDVGGFEKKTGSSGGGIQATGNHPGRARNPAELRADLEFAFSRIPGKHRLNLHAFYLDTDETPARDEIEYRHFTPWVDWAKGQGLGLDFNPTFFAHAKADDNLTLSHPDQGIRDFWIEHGKRCREIAARIGQAMGSAAVNNIWVPDGYKDIPVDRMAARPQTGDYGRLSVMLQWRYAMENILFVPPESFDPPPRVDSAVVRMVPLAHPPVLDMAVLQAMVQVAFSQRRKLLRHTLGAWLEQRGFAGAFDVQRRAEEVPVHEYVALAQALTSATPDTPVTAA